MLPIEKGCILRCGLTGARIFGFRGGPYSALSLISRRRRCSIHPLRAASHGAAHTARARRGPPARSSATCTAPRSLPARKDSPSSSGSGWRWRGTIISWRLDHPRAPPPRSSSHSRRRRRPRARRRRRSRRSSIAARRRSSSHGADRRPPRWPPAPPRCPPLRRRPPPRRGDGLSQAQRAYRTCVRGGGYEN